MNIYTAIFQDRYWGVLRKVLASIGRTTDTRISLLRLADGDARVIIRAVGSSVEHAAVIPCDLSITPNVPAGRDAGITAEFDTQMALSVVDGVTRGSVSVTSEGKVIFKDTYRRRAEFRRGDAWPAINAFAGMTHKEETLFIYAHTLPGDQVCKLSHILQVSCEEDRGIVISSMDPATSAIAFTTLKTTVRTV